MLVVWDTTPLQYDCRCMKPQTAELSLVIRQTGEEQEADRQALVGRWSPNPCELEDFFFRKPRRSDTFGIVAVPDARDTFVRRDAVGRGIPVARVRQSRNRRHLTRFEHLHMKYIDCISETRGKQMASQSPLPPHASQNPIETPSPPRIASASRIDDSSRWVTKHPTDLLRLAPYPAQVQGPPRSSKPPCQPHLPSPTPHTPAAAP